MRVDIHDGYFWSVRDIHGKIQASAASRSDMVGLSGLAILAIVLNAVGIPLFRSGFAGVDVAFVMAGFLIGGQVDRDIRNGRFSLWAFYAQCARRIMPTLMLVVLTTCLLSLLLMSARELRLASMAATTALLGIPNIFYWWASKNASAILHMSPLLMTWAVGVTIQFCALFPLLLLAMRRWRRELMLVTLALLFALSLGLCAIVTAYRPTTAFYLPHMRAWEFGAGALLAMLWSHPARPRSAGAREVAGIAGLAMVLASFYLFPDGARYPGTAAMLPAGGTLLLLLGRGSRVNRHMLGFPPLTALGTIAFSLYLWHAPLLMLADMAAFGEPGPVSLTPFAVAAVPIAWAGSRLLERPFADHGQQGVRASRISLMRLAMATALCAAVPTSLFLLRGAPQRLGPKALAVERTIENGRANPCIAPYGSSEPSTAPSCYRETGGKGTMALIGDSHAAALGPGFATLARKKDVGLVQIEKSACLPLLEPTVPPEFETAHDRQCAAFNQTAFQKVAQDPRIDTVVLTGFWSGAFLSRDTEQRAAGLFRRDPSTADEDRLGDALTQTIRRYRAAGKDVLVLGDVPLFRFDPGQEAVSSAITLRGELRDLIGTPDDAGEGVAAMRWVRPETAAENVVEQSAAAVPGTRYLPLRDLMCDGGACRYAGVKGSFYIDFHHLSRQGAEYVASRMDL